MGIVVTEVVIVLLLVLANGVFAMTEIAIVSARKARLRKLAEGGDERARVALELADSPNRFLSTVQVGITLVGVLAGALGGATIAEQIGVRLGSLPVIGPYGEIIGIGVVVLGITYLSLVIGELVPKRLAMSNPEGIARIMAKPMNALSKIGAPVVRMLGYSTDIVLRALGAKQDRRARVSEEEVKLLLQEGVEAGVFHKAEPLMVERVLALDTLAVSEIMTPRAKIVFLSKDDPPEVVWQKIVAGGHSNFPVYEGNRDNIVGMVAVKALYANVAAGATARLQDLAVPPLFVPATQTVTQLLEAFRQTGKHIALVIDEFGGVVGLATLVDVLEAITGEIPTQEERLKPKAKKRDDQSWLVDGIMEVEQLEKIIPGLRFPRDPSRPYDTVAGFVVAQLGRVPDEGEAVDFRDHRFEVIDMDRQRIDKLLVRSTRSQSTDNKASPAARK